MFSRRRDTRDQTAWTAVTPPEADTKTNPYPPDWERVAELRVFHTTPGGWAKLINWRAEMQRKGWSLLQVSSGANEMVAVFGRTKQELLDRKKED